MIRRRQLVGGLGICALLAAITLAAAPPAQSEAAGGYWFVALPALSGSTWPEAINIHGQVTGALRDERSANIPFLWSPATMQQLTLPKGRTSGSGRGVNHFGHVAGYSHPVKNGATSTIWEDPVAPITAGFPNDSYLTDLNDVGQSVGVRLQGSNNHVVFLSQVEKGRRRNYDLVPGYQRPRINQSGQVLAAGPTLSDRHAVLWTPDTNNGTKGQAQVIEDLWPEDLNDSGEIVGRRSSAGGLATLWLPAERHGLPRGLNTLPTPGETFVTRAYGLNNQATVVGNALESQANSHFAVIWRHEPDGTWSIRDLNDLVVNLPAGWLLHSAKAINDTGWIIGSALDQDEVYRGFVLIPQ